VTRSLGAADARAMDIAFLECINMSVTCFNIIFFLNWNWSCRCILIFKSILNVCLFKDKQVKIMKRSFLPLLSGF